MSGKAVESANNLGVPRFLTAVTPTKSPSTVGWYESGRVAHRADGRPSNVDFLPSNLFDNQTKHEDI